MMDQLSLVSDASPRHQLYMCISPSSYTDYPLSYNLPQFSSVLPQVCAGTVPPTKP